MKNLESLPAEMLLKVNRSEELFSECPREAKAEFRKLVLMWHPDRNKGAEAASVFQRIVILYKEAVKKFQDGNWQEPAEKIYQESVGLKKFKRLDGHTVAVQYVARRAFELGTMYIANHHVTFEISNEFSDLFDNGCEQIRRLRFQNRKMAIEMSPYLPQIEDRFRTANSYVLTLRKTPDQLLLADVFQHFDGSLPQPEHLGWILNSLFNVCCYLEWAQIAHNGIDVDTVFISPLRHSSMLLGGWWYSVAVGEKLLALPQELCTLMADEIARSGRATARCNLIQLRALGRKLLNAGAAEDARNNHSVLTEWLSEPAGNSACADYAQWKNDILVNSFGRPRFVDLAVDGKALYKEV
jgi:hypothetical protein